MSSKVGSGRFTAKNRTLATAAVVMMCLGVTLPAAAASGFKNCPGQFGWIVATVSAPGSTRPPGSYYTYTISPGTSTRVALDSAGNGLIGGGNWSVTSSGTASGVPSCRDYA